MGIEDLQGTHGVKRCAGNGGELTEGLCAWLLGTVSCEKQACEQLRVGRTWLLAQPWLQPTFP